MNSYKVALISPAAVASTDLVKRVQPPLGLACIAATLLEAGFTKLLVLDAVVEGYDHEEELSNESGLYQYGLPSNEVALRIKDFGAKVVGIASLFSAQAECAFSIAREIKKYTPDVIIVMGGNHATYNYSDVLKNNPDVDYILTGEGDYTFVEFVEFCENGKDLLSIPGLVWRDANRIKQNSRPPFIKNLDDLPLPAWHLMPMEKYFEIGMPHNPYTRSNRVACIMTSRGCPYKCYFCSSSDFFGHGYRSMTAKRAAEMVGYLVNEFGVEELQIEDDSFTLNAKRVIEFCNLIKKYCLRITLPNAIRADAPIDHSKRLEMFKAMKEAGVEQIATSVEHGDEKFLNDVIGKRLQLDEVIATCDLAHEAGLLVHANFMMGFPEETEDQRLKTIKFARELDADSFSVSLATPLPGTDMWSVAEESNLFMSNFNLNRVLYSEVSITPKDISPFDLKTLVADFNKELNYKAMNKRSGAKDKYKLFKGKSTHGDRKYISLDNQDT